MQFSFVTDASFASNYKTGFLQIPIYELDYFIFCINLYELYELIYSLPLIV